MPKTTCKEVPKKKCKDFPIFIPRKECKHFPKTICLKDPIQTKKTLSKKVCFSVPSKKCNKIPVEYVKHVPKTVSKKVCFSTKDKHGGGYGHSGGGHSGGGYGHSSGGHSGGGYGHSGGGHGHSGGGYGGHHFRTGAGAELSKQEGIDLKEEKSPAASAGAPAPSPYSYGGGYPKGDTVGSSSSQKETKQDQGQDKKGQAGLSSSFPGGFSFLKFPTF